MPSAPLGAESVLPLAASLLPLSSEILLKQNGIRMGNLSVGLEQELQWDQAELPGIKWPAVTNVLLLITMQLKCDSHTGQELNGSVY